MALRCHEAVGLRVSSAPLSEVHPGSGRRRLPSSNCLTIGPSNITVVCMRTAPLALALLLFSFQSPRARAADLERWLYCSQNLWVDENINKLEALFDRAAKAGYTHVLLSDSKFAKLGDMDARYFRNIERVKKQAAGLHLEFIPALFPVGYSNDLLWHDPNLIEALPVHDALFVVQDGVAT